MEPFQEFLKNTDKKSKTIEQIALSEYDFFLKTLIKKAYLGRYEKKHEVELVEKLADLYLDLNDYIPKKVCSDCDEVASFVKIQKEGDYLSGGFQSLCKEHKGQNTHSSHQLSLEMLPIMFNSRYALKGKDDRRKFDRYLQASLGLKSTRSPEKVSEAIGSLDHILSENVRKNAKDILLDYMKMAPSQRGTEAFKNDLKNKLYKIASEKNIYRLSRIFGPILEEGIHIICHEFKEYREELTKIELKNNKNPFKETENTFRKLLEIEKRTGLDDDRENTSIFLSRLNTDELKHLESVFGPDPLGGYAKINDSSYDLDFPQVS